MVSPCRQKKQMIMKKRYAIILNLIHKLFKKDKNMKMWYLQTIEVKVLSTKLAFGYSFSSFLDEQAQAVKSCVSWPKASRLTQGKLESNS